MCAGCEVKSPSSIGIMEAKQVSFVSVNVFLMYVVAVVDVVDAAAAVVASAVLPSLFLSSSSSRFPFCSFSYVS